MRPAHQEVAASFLSRVPNPNRGYPIHAESIGEIDADNQSPLKGRFDLDRVAAFGHSIGATAAVQVAKDDPRVRAAILLTAQ